MDTSAADLLRRAERRIHRFLANAELPLDHIPSTVPEPLPFAAVKRAVLRSGHWPPSLLEARRLPRSLLHVRNSTALLGRMSTVGSYRDIALALGGINPGSVLYGCRVARCSLMEGQPRTQDLVAAATLLLLRDHPHARASMNDDIWRALHDAVARHAAPEPHG